MNDEIEKQIEKYSIHKDLREVLNIDESDYSEYIKDLSKISQDDIYEEFQSYNKEDLLNYITNSFNKHKTYYIHEYENSVYNTKTLPNLSIKIINLANTPFDFCVNTNKSNTNMQLVENICKSIDLCELELLKMKYPNQTVSYPKEYPRLGIVYPRNIYK